jgi:hypothetical protein
MKKSDEAHLQAAIVKALRSAGVFVHSVPNELAGGNAVRTGQAITTGLYPGVADLVVWLPGGQVAYFEVKAPTGKQSPAQVKFQARCEQAGVYYTVVKSVEETLEKISFFLKK